MKLSETSDTGLTICNALTWHKQAGCSYSIKSDQQDKCVFYNAECQHCDWCSEYDKNVRAYNRGWHK